MFLVITNSEDATVDFVLGKNASSDHFFRFNTDQVLLNCSIEYTRGQFQLYDGQRWISSGAVKNVWYRRPECFAAKKVFPETIDNFTLNEWAAAFENYFGAIPRERWINHPQRNAVAGLKLQQLTNAEKFGLRVPETHVSQDLSSILKFIDRHGGDVVAKPIYSGSSREDGQEYLIYTTSLKNIRLSDFDLTTTPTLYQQEIQKSLDVRITILDGFIESVSMAALDLNGRQRCDIRRNSMLDVKYEKIAIPEQISNSISKFLEHYHLRFAAIDMVIDRSGEWYFLEVNPNGQWAWLDIEAGTNIADQFLKLSGVRMGN